jgi:hypothetical protein
MSQPHPFAVDGGAAPDELVAKARAYIEGALADCARCANRLAQRARLSALGGGLALGPPPSPRHGSSAKALCLGVCQVEFPDAFPGIREGDSDRRALTVWNLFA